MTNLSDTIVRLPSLDGEPSNVAALWTPGSQQIVMEWGTWDEPQLYRYGIASQKATPIGPTRRPFALSQDGRYLAAYDCATDIIGTCIITNDGQRTVILAHPDSGGGYPGSYRFHPTEGWVIIQEGNQTASGSLFTVASVDGKVQRNITKCSFDGTCIDWLPDRVVSQN